MSHTDVKAALTSGIAAIHAWAAGEKGKIAAAHAGAIAHDAAVASLSAEFKGLHVEEKLPAKYFNEVVVFRNAHGKHLQLRDNDTYDHHTNKGGWEKWTITDAGEGYVFITSFAFKPKKLQGRDDRKSISVHTNSGGWERWKLIDAGGGKVMIQTKNWGTQLSQDDHGKVSQSPNTAGWEQFEIILIDDSRAKHRADVEARLRAAEAAAKSAADATAASQEAGLAAEVARRIQVKTDLANRIESELAGLAVL